MYVREVFAGRYEPRPNLTDFPNVRRLDELYTVGPISVRSMCSHHLCSVTGHAWIGVIPGERVIGLSKFNRITEWVMARPQIQEKQSCSLPMRSKH
ncbi:GTP cyclohydrolase I [Paraburkholderia sp. EG304]|uniref:GTP cyclohydrolase I n=1 Tax=Paraburkholderia sp. EG304 TaxID=3237015 RepID=UPI00397E0687